MFFVDLPSAEERQKTSKIHLRKRNQSALAVDVVDVVRRTDGFNGADIEAIVKQAVEDAFLRNPGNPRVVDDDLMAATRHMKGFSQTLKKKVETIRLESERL